MTKPTRRELNKLRELFWFLIRGRKCAHCDELFLEEDVYQLMRHGDGTGDPLTLKLTIDHQDGDHLNNAGGNHRLMHSSCHKTHHAVGMIRVNGKFCAQGQGVKAAK